MRILVTGGTGFVGSHLTGALLSAGHQVTILSRSSNFAYSKSIRQSDLPNLKHVSGSIATTPVLEELVNDADVIFHKAASVGVEDSSRLVREFTATNVGGTANLIEALRNAEHRVRKIILGSSISVYGEGSCICRSCAIVRPAIRYKAPHPATGWEPSCPRCGGGIVPTSTLETAERNGESIYAISKKAQEDLLVATCRQQEIPLIILRYCSVYGPGQSLRNPYSRIIMDLVNGGAANINEDGKQTRDFVHVEDVVKCNLLALQDPASGIQCFNVGTGVQTALVDYVSRLTEVIGRRLGSLPPATHPSENFIPGDVRHCMADCSALFDRYSYAPATSLDEGIELLVAWFVENYRGIAADTTTLLNGCR